MYTQNKIILYPTLVFNSKRGIYPILLAVGNSKWYPPIRHIASFNRRFDSKKIWYTEADAGSYRRRGKKIAGIEIDMDLGNLPEMFTPFIERYQSRPIYYGYYSTGINHFLSYLSENDNETYNILVDTMQELLARLASSSVPKALVNTINIPHTQFGIGRKVYYILETYGASGSIWNRCIYEEKSHPVSRNCI